MCVCLPVQLKSIHLCVSLSLCLSVRPSVRPSVCLSVCLSFCLSVFLSFCLSVFLSFCLSVFPSTCPSVCLCLSFCLSVCLSVSLSLSLSLYLFLSLSLSLFCFSLSLSMSLSLSFLPCLCSCLSFAITISESPRLLACSPTKSAQTFLAPLVPGTHRGLPFPNSRTRVVSSQVLSGPNAILRCYRCDTPYRAILLFGGWHTPKMVRYPSPPYYLVLQRHICNTPFCNISRDNCAIPHKNKHEIILRYYRYKYRAT